MRNFILVVLFASLIISCQEEEKYPGPCEEFDAVDLEMLNLIKEIEEKYKENRIFIIRFREAQIYWIQYRDRHVRAIYPQNWDKYYRRELGKELFNPCKCKELLRIAKARVEELKLYLNGGPLEQEECPGIWSVDPYKEKIGDRSPQD